jgi:hypothetical protein
MVQGAIGGRRKVLAGGGTASVVFNVIVFRGLAARLAAEGFQERS